MRKVLLLFFVLFLVACGSNELDQTLVDDTNEVIEIIDGIAYEDKELSQSDREVIGEYLDYYGNKDLNEKDTTLYNRMWYILEYPEEAANSVEEYEVSRDLVMRAMPEGDRE